MKKTLLGALAVMLFLNANAEDKTYKVQSPNGKLSIEMNIGDKIKYSVKDNGITLLKDNNISLNIEGVGEIGNNAKVTN